MGNNFIHEWVKVEYVEFDGTHRKHFANISGPVIEAAKSLDWIRQVIERDGGKITAATFGTLQGGEFHPRNERKTPVTAFDGFRRLAQWLRA